MLLPVWEPNSSGLTLGKGDYGKDLYRKTEEAEREEIVSPDGGNGLARDRSPLLRIELTPQQAEIMRCNENFQHLYGAQSAPIFLNLHFNEGLPQKMLKVSEICQMLQVSRNTLGKLLKAGP